MKNILFIINMTIRVLFLFSIIFLLFNCNKKKELTQLEIAKFYIYSDLFKQNSFKDNEINKVINQSIILKEKIIKNDSINYNFKVKDFNKIQISQKNKIDCISKVGFVGESKLIRYTVNYYGYMIIFPYYNHYIKNDKNSNWIYLGLDKKFILDTLKNDSMYFQKIDKKFVDLVIKNKKSANKELVTIAENIKQNNYSW